MNVTSRSESDVRESVCPSCGTVGMAIFYEVERVPVHSVLLMPTRERALAYPSGRIRLGLCWACGFVSNAAFDAAKLEYSAAYEETQAFSPTFNRFHRRIAEHLVERYALRNKNVIEIGCGKGEFLALLCDLGENRGVGFDPGYVEGRTAPHVAPRLSFVRDFYSKSYSHYEADLVCCKMTLEHIPATGQFVAMIRKAIEDRPGAIVFFQVPNLTRILREGAFWDIYYEHCSYFTPFSLARLLRIHGFEVLDVRTEYEEQYLLIEARAGRGNARGEEEADAGAESVRDDVAYFTTHCPSKLEEWRRALEGMKHRGQRVVLWGAGSKAVSFLSTLAVGDFIEYAVDVNPHKWGTFLPGCGQEIAAPEAMRGYRPDVVIIMNSIYREEIQSTLRSMQLEPEVLVL